MGRAAGTLDLHGQKHRPCPINLADGLGVGFCVLRRAA